MAASRRRLQHVQQSGAQSLRSIRGNAHLMGNVIRRLETHAVNVLRKTIRVRVQHRQRLIAIGLVDAQRAGGADAMLVQEEHDVVHALLLHPRFADLQAPLAADALHVFQLH